MKPKIEIELEFNCVCVALFVKQVERFFFFFKFIFEMNSNFYHLMHQWPFSVIALTFSYFRKIKIKQFRHLSPSSCVSQEKVNQNAGSVSSRGNSLPRPISPSPSVASEKNEGETQVCTFKRKQTSIVYG